MFGSIRATVRILGEGREGCVKSSKSTREGGPKRDHDFLTLLTLPNSDPRREYNTREQSHRGHYFETTRDCDQPIDESKALPTVQMLSETAKQVRKKEREPSVKPHTTRLPKQQEDQKGIRGERGGGSVTLLGKRAIRRGGWGWMLTMNTHGVECLNRQVCRGDRSCPNSMPFFLFLVSFFFDLRFVSSSRYKKCM